ncbi:VRR-NUC domain-containing protein [Brachyspira murdochii]|uniref:VRR-NUC domain-containing protein n=1 Tax=Brachyspira murdochii TaxID=84378 RepID=UPI003005610B
MIIYRKIDEKNKIKRYKKIISFIEYEKRDKDPFKENQIQNMIIAYLNEKHIDYHPSMSGIKASSGLAKFMKSQGIKAGHSDLIIYAKTKKHEILLLELKTVKGRLSDVQKEWLKDKAKQGYAVSVAYGYYEAVYKIEKYLEDKPILYSVKILKDIQEKLIISGFLILEDLEGE